MPTPAPVAAPPPPVAPPPPAAAPAPPPLGFDYEESVRAISRLFQKERTEDLPVEQLRTVACAELSDAHFATLLERLDDENKVMVHAGTAYQI